LLLQLLLKLGHLVLSVIRRFRRRSRIFARRLFSRRVAVITARCDA
jgi:hypothetical protein